MDARGLVGLDASSMRRVQKREERSKVEMLKKRTEQARPSLGFVGTGERELGARAGVVLRQEGQG